MEFSVNEGVRTLLYNHQSGIIHEQGLIVREAGATGEHTFLMAVLGATGSPHTSIMQSQLRCVRWSKESLMRRALELRMQLHDLMREAGQYTVIDGIQAALADEWPKGQDDLFIATPRLGLEQELVELLLLEALTADAEAGDETAAALLSHLVEESGAASVSELIYAQRSRVQQMIDDQQEQLRIHAEAVVRAEQRSLQLKAAKAELHSAASANVLSSATDSTTAPFASALSANTTAAAVADAADALLPATTALSLSSASSNSADVDGATVCALATQAHSELKCSWTADPGLATVESLREPGRVKFRTILKSTKRFLAALRPERVQQAGSHCVFHFADRGPVTLVLKHSGGSKDSSVSRHYRTQLYETLHGATLSPFGMRQQESRATLQAGSGGCAQLK